MTKRNRHEGSSFEEFLHEERLHEDVTAAAFKRVLAWHLEQAMAKENVSKGELATLMRTSRAALDRLLDPDNTAVTLKSISSAFSALGNKLVLQIETRRAPAPRRRAKKGARPKGETLPA